MASDGLELGAEIIDRVVEHKGDVIYDKVAAMNPFPSRNKDVENKPSSNGKTNSNSEDQSTTSGPRRRQRAEPLDLPTPEPDTTHRNDYINSQYPRQGDPYFDQRSETSERVLRQYENERDDPRRRPVDSAVGSAYSRRTDYRDKDKYNRRDMSYDYDRRPSSQQPPRSRYDDDEYSDYDERTGKRYSRSGRGYDDGKDYDREIIETERYRGPARDWEGARSSSYKNDDYAVAQYKRKSGDMTAYDDGRQSSRGRRSGEYYDERDGHDRHREREHHEERNIKEKLEETFDTTPKGIGFAVAGALAGGLVGRQLGKGQHQQRDMIIGALVGGLGANIAENKYSEYKSERELDREEERYDNRDYRSRSAMR